MSSKQNPTREIFFYLTLVLVYGLLCVAFFAHQGHILVDCGREVCFPERIVKGDVLFKDIFVLFGPLSYQINAFLYNTFGVHMNTLYFAGIANSFVILTVFYLIARKITSIKVSWLASFVLMAVCIFHYFVPNFIFPYAYAMVYALSGFLISVLFSIYYLEGSKSLFLILSALFMGASAVSKPDFILFSFVLIAIALHFKPLEKKNLVLFFLSFLVVPILSWGELFLKGLSFSDISAYFKIMADFVGSNFFKYFYAEHTGLYPSPTALKALLASIKEFMLNFSALFAIFYVFFWLFSKIPPSKSKIAIQVICFILLYIVLPKDFFKNIGGVMNLAWLPVGATVILLLSLKDRIFALVTIAGIISSIKSYFFINLHVFGTFLIPLLILVTIVFFIDKLPEMIKFINKQAWRQSCFTIVFILSLVFMTTNMDYAIKHNNSSIETNKGKIYSSQKWGSSLKKLVSYINNEVPANSSFIVLPEGVMINFLTNRNSNSWYHTFTPHFIDVYGENKVIQHIKKTKPDYIFITNQDTDDYYYRFFCRDYAKDICKYIQNNYNYIKRLEGNEKDHLWVDIYKRRLLNGRS